MIKAWHVSITRENGATKGFTVWAFDEMGAIEGALALFHEDFPHDQAGEIEYHVADLASVAVETPAIDVFHWWPVACDSCPDCGGAMASVKLTDPQYRGGRCLACGLVVGWDPSPAEAAEAAEWMAPPYPSEY